VPVDGEGDGVHPQVALQQPPVDAGVVLVGVAAHEGVDTEGVRADVEADRCLELLLSGQAQRERRTADLLVLDPVLDEMGADGVDCPGGVGHVAISARIRPAARA
jgi:hypothetical protein